MCVYLNTCTCMYMYVTKEGIMAVVAKRKSDTVHCCVCMCVCVERESAQETKRERARV